MYIPYASTENIDKIRASADIIEELAGGLVTYLGFCRPGTLLTSESTWSIMIITQSSDVLPIITVFNWAGGSCAYNLVWDNRAGYDFAFKNF